MRIFISALIAVSFVGVAQAAPPKVLFSTLATSTTSDVPGMPGIKWVTTLGRIYAAPIGQYFVMIAPVTGASQRGIVTGLYGTPGSYNTWLRTTGTWPLNAGETCNDIRSVAGINDNGEFCFAASNSAVASINEHSIKKVSSGFSAVAREGDFSALLGANTVSAITSNQILANGSAVWGSGINSTTADGGYFSESQLFVKRGVTIPTGQQGTPAPIMRLDTDKFRMGQIDNSYIYQCVVGTGTVTSAGSSVMVVDNAVMAQVGFTLAGSTNTNTVSSFGAGASVGGSSMSSRNRHFAFSGSMSNGKEFAAFGTVGGPTQYLFEGDPVATGATELFSATGTAFSGTAVNSYGESVVCSDTNEADTTKNYVVVFNNGYYSKVVYRRGDAIDLDGNGLADDNLAFQAIASDNLMFCDNNRLFLGCTLRTNTATTSGLSQIVIDLPITGDVDGSGEVDAADIDMVIAAFGSTTPEIPEDVDGSVEVDAADIDIVISNFGRTR